MEGGGTQVEYGVELEHRWVWSGVGTQVELGVESEHSWSLRGGRRWNIGGFVRKEVWELRHGRGLRVKQTIGCEWSPCVKKGVTWKDGGERLDA